MKTKTLLIAAAALAATVISSQAQVYSGIVGYANVNLTNGYNAFANQIDFDGTGTNNTIYTTLGTNLPALTKVEAFDPSLPGFRTITYNGAGTWSAGTAGTFVKQALQPGGGVFVFIPGSNPTNVTLVGNILQGTNIVTYPSQYQFVAYPFPVAGYLTTNFNYVANAPVASTFDTVEIWNPVTQSFQTHKYSGSAWTAGSPNLAAGQPFFLIPNQTTIWTNALTVQ